MRHGQTDGTTEDDPGVIKYGISRAVVGINRYLFQYSIL